MLLEFTVGNYRSFKEPVTFSLLATTLKEHEDSNIFTTKKYRLLKSAIFFGANASGKSNFFKAVSFMKRFVFSSAKETQATEKIDVENFKLSTETENKPTHFEIIFFIDEIRYRYGFRLNENRIEAEWLFYVPRTKEAKLFIRELDHIVLGYNFKEGKGLEDKTRKNALFLSVVAQFNGKISSKILMWFSQLNIISGLDDTSYMGYTIEKLQDPEFKKWVLNYLTIADIDILDIQTEARDVDLDSLPLPLQKIIEKNIVKEGNTAIKGFSISTCHQKYDRGGQKASFEVFDITNHESEGTQKILALAGPLWDTLREGKILFIDEFDARLHQKLTIALVKLFNSKKSNPNHAQFILATHDTNLLRSDLFRRDQIWFIDKNRYGISDIYSLSDYKESNKVVRKDASFSKNYLMGRYGAVPLPHNFEELFEVEDNGK